MSLSLMTGSYSHWRPQHGVLVRASLGRPKWFPEDGSLLPQLKPATPAPWYLKGDVETFDLRYAAQLERWGINRVLADLYAIATEHGAERLVIGCFEGDPSACHRSVFARWFEEQTGQRVPDLTDVNR